MAAFDTYIKARKNVNYSRESELHKEYCTRCFQVFSSRSKAFRNKKHTWRGINIPLVMQKQQKRVRISSTTQVFGSDPPSQDELPKGQYGDEVKKIFVVQNGSPEPAKRVVVSKRQANDWQKMLEQMTEDVLPTRGYIRSLHTPVNGTPIRRYDALKNGELYVALGPWDAFTAPKARANPSRDLPTPSTRAFKVGNPNSKYSATKFIPSTGRSVPYY